MESQISEISYDLATLTEKNKNLSTKLSRLQNHNSGARGELLNKNYIYKEIFTQNLILLTIILSSSGFYLYKKYKS